MVYKLIYPFKELPIGLRIAFRAGVLQSFVWFALFLGASVLLAAQFSARQPATVALDVGLSVLRLGLPLLLVFLLQELVGREFERRSYLTSLSYPRARSQWLLSRLLTALLLLGALITVAGGGLALLVQWIGSWYQQDTPPDLGLPYVITLSLIGLDTLVVLAIAGLLSVMASTPFFVILGTIGFTLIARSYMPIVQLLQDSGYLVEKIANPQLYQESLSFLAFLLPDLGSLDVRMISLYGKMSFLPENIWFLVAAASTYSIALIALSVWRLNRREFN